jgi:hypothetical protein
MEKTFRYLLSSLLLLVGVNAFLGGYYAIAGARNVPTSWLEGSPFTNYFIPGLVLFFVVGGCCLTAAIVVFRNRPMARRAALISASVIVVWLAIQISIIGYVSWMQPVTATVTLLIFLLTLALK